MKSTNQKKPEIILASGSSSRKQQLIDLGFQFTVKTSGVDEEAYKKTIIFLYQRCAKLLLAPKWRK